MFCYRYFKISILGVRVGKRDFDGIKCFKIDIMK